MQSVVLAGVAAIEYVLLLHVFTQLIGINDGWLSPSVLAFVSAIMIAAVHLQAKASPNGLTARVLERITGPAIVLYLLGVGLLFSATLYLLGLGELVRGPEPLPLPGQPQPLDAATGWLEWVFEKITNPLGALVFSLGAGAAALVSCYVACALIRKIVGHFETIALLRYRLRTVLAAHREALAGERRFSELGLEEAQWVAQTRALITDYMAAETLARVGEALAPHRSKLQYALLEDRQVPLVGDDDQRPLKLRRKLIAAIDKAITFEAIRDALKKLKKRS